MSDPKDKKNEEVKPEPEATAPEETPTGETVAEENGPVNVGHQDNDLDLKTVQKFILISFGVTIAFFILMLVVLKFYKSGFEEERGVAVVEERQIPSKNEALLQTQPLVEKAEYDNLEENRLNTTTNAADHAVIPVQAAKQLMLEEKAFPTATPKSEVAATELSPMIDTSSLPAATSAPETAPAAPAAATEPAPDPAMVAAGKVIFETQCMAACHTGKPGAIGPNIQKAFGTYRKLENQDPVLMDEDYVLHSMNNPMDQIAKGYMPVMISFKDSLNDKEKSQVVTYLKSIGKPIVKAAPAPAAAPAPTAAPAVKPVPAVPAAQPTAVPAAPEAPAPAEPEKPEAPKGVIFV